MQHGHPTPPRRPCLFFVPTRESDSVESVLGWGGLIIVACLTSGHHRIPEKEQKAACLPSHKQSTRRKQGDQPLDFPAGSLALEASCFPSLPGPGSVPGELSACLVNRCQKAKCNSYGLLVCFLTLT